MIEKLPLESLAPVDVETLKVEIDVDWARVMDGCPRMPELVPVRRLTVADRRMDLWVACSGRCVSCGAFLAVDTLVPMWIGESKERLGAACAICAQKTTKEGGHNG